METFLQFNGYFIIILRLKSYICIQNKLYGFYKKPENNQEVFHERN